MEWNRVKQVTNLNHQAKVQNILSNQNLKLYNGIDYITSRFIALIFILYFVFRGPVLNLCPQQGQ